MDLVLHIGHGKTGSSALQSFLANNSEILKEYGVLYPKHESFNLAKKGYISTGNILAKEDLFEAIEDSISEASINKKITSILFSSESLFMKIIRNHKKIKILDKKYNLTVIMYVRNPLDHALSAYGQMVKRGGETRLISEWIKNYRALDQVIKLIKICKVSSIRLNIINYSNIESIEKSFLNVLLNNNSQDFLKKCTIQENLVVNRSLSKVEYEIQRNFNKYFGKRSSKFISDQLVNSLPFIESEKESIDEYTLNHFIKNNREKVEFINSFLDEKNKLDLSKPKDITYNSKVHQISSDQIEVLTESISNKIKQKSQAALVDSDANILRNIALKYEREETLNIEEATYLMQLASKARPNGEFIKNKYLKYNKKIIEIPK